MSTPVLLGARFALFADCLLVGCCAAVAAVPVVTAYPALVAACALLRERVEEDRTASLRRYARRLAQTVHSGPAGLLVPPLLGTILAGDALAVLAGVPGRVPLAVLLVVVASAAAVLGLRLAAKWRPGTRWSEVAHAAAHATVRDAQGSALLWLAAATAAGIALAVPLAALLVAGPLALAAVAVDLRTRDRPQST